MGFARKIQREQARIKEKATRKQRGYGRGTSPVNQQVKMERPLAPVAVQKIPFYKRIFRPRKIV